MHHDINALKSVQREIKLDTVSKKSSNPREYSTHNQTHYDKGLLHRVLGANWITCSFIDKSAPFHNQISVIHNIFVKFLQTTYFYNAESARKVDAQLKFQYTGCLIWYSG